MQFSSAASSELTIVKQQLTDAHEEIAKLRCQLNEMENKLKAADGKVQKPLVVNEPNPNSLSSIPRHYLLDVLGMRLASTRSWTTFGLYFEHRGFLMSESQLKSQFGTHLTPYQYVGKLLEAMRMHDAITIPDVLEVLCNKAIGQRHIAGQTITELNLPYRIDDRKIVPL